MASTAISAQGSTVMIDDSTVGTPDVEIKNISSFSGFDGEASEIDITNLSSDAKEYAVGLQDFGGFSMEIHPDFDDEGQNVLRNAGNATKTFKITLPNSKVLTFKGLVKNANSLNGGVDAVLTGTVSIKVTGQVVVS